MSLSSRTEDDHQRYLGGSVVGKASLIDPEILPTPRLIFTVGQKVQNLESFSTSSNFKPPVFENAARSLNFETNVVSVSDCHMSSASLVKFGPHSPENHPEKVPHRQNWTAKV